MNCCKVCGESKDDMDMHNDGLCKSCWAIDYDRIQSVGAKVWKTRRERYGWKGHKGYYKGEKVKSKVGKVYY